MCGIAGAVSLGGGAPTTAEELRRVNDAMRLRGPDDEGTWTDGTCVLGQRRLSIIDLAGGHQPIGNEDDAVQVVCNGEIYNFEALRQRLEGLGHRFRTRSDTEVIVHGWEEWGEAVVEHLDGMFALAVWDCRQRKLLLARDRFGKKPLCWFKSGDRFVFASTLTALLSHRAAPRALDPSALARYLAFEFVPGPQSIIAGVQKLEAGTTLLLDARGHQRKQRYFRLEVRARTRVAPDAEVDEELRRRLIEATRKRLVADVPVGIFLSGGVDSSSVAAAAIQAGARRIKTFSIGFDEPSFDESAYARLVSRHLGTDHIEERVTAADLLAIVPHVGEILDEPMADGSIVPTFALSRMARRHVTVALGGDGGDELFAGYPTYLAHRFAGLARPLLSGRLGALARRAAAALPVSHDQISFDFKVKTTLAGLDFPDEVRNYVWLGAFRPDEVGPILGRPVDEQELFAPIAEAYRQAPGDSHVERVLYQDVVLYLCHEILVKVDRASMANSLEVRAPMLDTAFAEYAAGLPLRQKLRGPGGKRALKRAVAPWLPRPVLERPKKGFGMPVGAWLRGPLRPLAHDLLLGGDGLCASGLVDRRGTERLLAEHERGQHDHRKRLWSLLVLELWRRNHQPSSTPPAPLA